MTRTLLILLLSTAQLTAATVTNLFLDSQGQPRSNTIITLTPLSTPYPDSPAVVSGPQIRQSTGAAGEFSINLKTGQYRVQVGNNLRDIFVIGVPDGPGPFNMADLMDLTAPIIPPGGDEQSVQIRVGSHLEGRLLNTNQFTIDATKIHLKDGPLVTNAVFTFSNGLIAHTNLAQLGITQASVRNFGAVGNGSTDDTAAFAAANATGLPIHVTPGIYRIASSITITNSVELPAGAVLRPDNGVTITLSRVFRAPIRQIFDLSAGGSVVFGTNGLRFAYPQWFGALPDDAVSDHAAFVAADAAIAAAGGNLNVPSGTYILDGPLTLSDKVNLIAPGATFRLASGEGLKPSLAGVGTLITRDDWLVALPTNAVEVSRAAQVNELMLVQTSKAAASPALSLHVGGGANISQETVMGRWFWSQVGDYLPARLRIGGVTYAGVHYTMPLSSSRLLRDYISPQQLRMFELKDGHWVHTGATVPLTNVFRSSALSSSSVFAVYRDATLTNWYVATATWNGSAWSVSTPTLLPVNDSYHFDSGVFNETNAFVMYWSISQSAMHFLHLSWSGSSWLIDNDTDMGEDFISATPISDSEIVAQAANNELRVYRFDGSWRRMPGSFTETDDFFSMARTYEHEWTGPLNGFKVYRWSGGQIYSLDTPRFDPTIAVSFVPRSGAPSAAGLVGAGVSGDPGGVFKFQRSGRIDPAVTGVGTSVSGVSSLPQLVRLDNGLLAVVLLESGVSKLTSMRFDNPGWSELGSRLNLPSSVTVSAEMRTNRVAFVHSDNTLRAYQWTNSAWASVGSALTLPTNAWGAAKLTESRIAVTLADGTLRAYDFDGSIWTQTGSATMDAAVTMLLAALDRNMIALMDSSAGVLTAYTFDGSNWTSGASVVLTLDGGTITGISGRNVVHYQTTRDVAYAYSLDERGLWRLESYTQMPASYNGTFAPIGNYDLAFTDGTKLFAHRFLLSARPHQVTGMMAVNRQNPKFALDVSGYEKTGAMRVTLGDDSTVIEASQDGKIGLRRTPEADFDIGYSTTRFTNNAVINWGSALGSSGYGLRDNAGVMEFKNSNGVWTAFSALPDGGEANTGQNLGSGSGVFADKSGVTLRFNSLTNAAPLTLSSNNNTIQFGFDSTAVLDNVARTTVRVNDGADVGSRRRINFTATGAASVTAVDDPANEETDVTIDATFVGFGVRTNGTTAATFVSGDDLNYVAGSNVVWTVNKSGNLINIQLDATGSGGGEANTGMNVGSGQAVYAGKSGVALEFNSLDAISPVTVQSNANTIQFGFDEGQPLGNNARVNVKREGIDIGARRSVNFQEGNAIVIGAGDDSLNEKVDVSIALDSTADLNNNARVKVLTNGVSAGIRRGLNLNAGTNVTITATDNGAGERVDVTINAAIPSGTGDITAVGDVTSGDAFTGTAGTKLTFAGGTNAIYNENGHLFYTNATSTTRLAVKGVNAGSQREASFGLENPGYFTSVPAIRGYSQQTGTTKVLTYYDEFAMNLFDPADRNALGSANLGRGIAFKSLSGDPALSGSPMSILYAKDYDYGSGTDSALFIKTSGGQVLGPLGIAGGGGGTITGAANVGTGFGVFKAESGGVLQFKSLTTLGLQPIWIDDASVADSLRITWDDSAPLNNKARVTVRKNSGADVGSRRRMNFLEGSGISITALDDPSDEEIDLIIAATGGSAGEANTASNLGTGIGVAYDKSGVDLRFNSLAATAPITISSNNNTITLGWNSTNSLDNNARVAVLRDNTLVGTRRKLNFWQSGTIKSTITDGPATETVDVTFDIDQTADLNNNARVGVRANSGGSTFKRRRLNVSGQSGVTVTAADDSVNEEVDVTISAPDLVAGPASATDKAIARFSGATGKLITDSVVILDDNGLVTAAGFAARGSNGGFVYLEESASDPATGPDEGVFYTKDVSGVTQPFYRPSDNGTPIQLGAGGGGSGEANTASNLGTGYPTFDSKSGVDLRFNTFTNGTSMVISSNANTFTIKRAALTGDVTAAEDSNATTIAADAVTNTKLANMNNGTIKGRGTAGAGDPEDLTVQSPLVLDGTGLSAPTVVVGPASATDNAVARYDGTTGKLIQNSLATVDDTGVVTATGFVATGGGGGDGVLTLSESTSDPTTGSNEGSVYTKDVSGTTRLFYRPNNNGTPIRLESLTVKEADGSPNVGNVNTITVSNGTLTDNGNGSVTLVTGGGGGGSSSGPATVVQLSDGSGGFTSPLGGVSALSWNESLERLVATNVAVGSTLQINTMTNDNGGYPLTINQASSNYGIHLQFDTANTAYADLTTRDDGALVLTTSQTTPPEFVAGVVSVSAPINYTVETRQTFAAGNNVAGVNLGALLNDPNNPIDGDLWYDGSQGLYRGRSLGQNVTLVAVPEPGIPAAGARLMSDGNTLYWATPYNTFFVMDEFLTVGASSTTALGDNSWGVYSSGTGATASAGNGEPTAPGVVEVGTGTTATGIASIYHRVTGQQIGGGALRWRARVKLSALSNSTDSYIVRFGLLDSATGTHANGVWFEYTDSVNGGNWQGKTMSASSTSTLSSTVAATTDWVRLEFQVNAGGTSVEFFVNGTSIGTLSTNVPTTDVGAVFQIVKTAGTSARLFSIDYMSMHQRFTTER